MDDLLARTHCFKCGELAHLAKDCPQNKEPSTISETFFSGMVCNDSCTVHPRHDFCADHSRDNSRGGVFRNESCADDDSRNEFSANVDSRTGCELKVTVKEMTKLSSVFEKMMFLFLVRAQASAQAQSLLLDHVRITVGT